jgi:hypothetical protein
LARSHRQRWPSFEQEATRVDAEVSAHEIALAVAAVKAELETVGASRFDAEVALEQEKRAHAETRQTLEARIAELERENAELVNAGAGTSEFARSQPSDACEIVNLRSQLEGAEMDVHVLRMERDNAESEAEALKVQRDDWHKLADERSAELVRLTEERDRQIADITREWSAHAMTRQELKASRAAHEQAMRERDAALDLTKEAAAQLENHALALCSEDSPEEEAVSQVIALLRGQP